jgi:hypothetical protein
VSTLDDLVLLIDVNLDASSVSRAGFGVPLIAGPNSSFAGGSLIQAFTSLASTLTSTGLTTSDPEYLAAQAMFAQGIRRVKIGTLPDRVAQVDTFTIGTAAAGAWVLTINGVTYTYTAGGGDTAANIATGLRGLVDADANAPVNDGGTSTAVALTAKIAGRAFTSSITPPGVGTASKASTTANVSLATGLNAIAAEDPEWYALVLTSRTAEDILQTAAWTESSATPRIFVAQTNDSSVFTSATDDIASQLQDAAYGRTALLAYKRNATARVDAGWVGFKLQANPDSQSTTWAHCTLAGVTVDSMTVSERDFVLAKKGNVYLPLKGVARTFDATFADGGYIDARIIADWLKARLEEDMAQELGNYSARNSKIPYTPAGFAVFEAIVRKRAEQGVRVGHFVDESLSLTIPALEDIASSDITSRIFRFSGSVRLAGAIHRIEFTINASAT